MTNKALLRFTPYAWAKLVYLRDKDSNEIGAFGIAEYPEHPLLVTDIVIPKQETSFASFEFDDNGLADTFEEMTNKGLHPYQHARIFIHTHPGSSASPSGTDENTFAEKFGQANWSVMFILAKDGACTCKIQFNIDSHGIQHKTDLPLTVDYNIPFLASDHKAWDKEFKEKVKKKTYIQTVYPSHGGARRLRSAWYEEFDEEESQGKKTNKLAKKKTKKVKKGKKIWKQSLRDSRICPEECELDCINDDCPLSFDHLVEGAD